MSAIIDTWVFNASKAGTEIVLPDGCQDVILERGPTGARLFVTDLHTSPHLAEIAAGVQLTGFRLCPGVQVDYLRLSATVHGCDDGEVSDLIEDLCSVDPAAAEAIACLSEAGSVTAAARLLGVSVRTLQRSFSARQLPPPRFWYLLGRARRAALSLPASPDLAQLAYATGYADQAHMTRAFRRWFGVTPVGLAARPDLRVQVAQPGLATGEQISTRYPFGSAT